jgi:hypothetical protein
MAKSAQVGSLDAIRLFRAALIKYAEEVDDALTSLKMELARAANWLHHEQPVYWREQVTRGWTRVSEARTNLEMCQMRKVAGERPGCHDEKIALEKAKRAVQRAEQLVDVVRNWGQKFQHETLEYQGQVGQLESFCEIDLKKAVAALDRILISLEAYAALHAPPSDLTAGGAAATSAANTRWSATNGPDDDNEDGKKTELPDHAAAPGRAPSDDGPETQDGST